MDTDDGFFVESPLNVLWNAFALESPLDDEGDDDVVSSRSAGDNRLLPSAKMSQTKRENETRIENTRLVYYVH